LVFFFGTVDLEYKQGKIAPQRLAETFSTVLRPPKQDRGVSILGREPKKTIEYHFETRNASRPGYPAPRSVKDRKIPVMDPETLPIPPPEPQRPPPPVPEWKNPDQAYVMLLTNDKPMHLAWALEGALRNVSSTRRRIALVTSDVSVPMRDVLSKLQIEVQVIPKLAHPNFKTAYVRWKDSLTKFAVFSLKNITKFVYLDTDLMINDNIDDFFDLDTNGLVHGMLDRPGCNNTSPWLNAGLLISSPNETLKHAMISSLNDTDNPTRGGGGDQEILNRYLSKQYAILYPSSNRQALRNHHVMLTSELSTWVDGRDEILVEC
jgi:hypothetical protein